MKRTYSTILATLLTVAVLLSGCTTIGTGSTKDKENIITEAKDFTDFTVVDVEGTFEIEIIQSDEFSITISADSNYFDYIAVVKEGETLRVFLNPRHILTDFTIQDRDLKVDITMPVLNGVHLSGASKGTVSGFRSTDDFRLDISGASSLDMVDIETGDLELEISGASRVSGNVSADDGKFVVSGASGAELQGSAKTVILNASGASSVDMTNFSIKTADVHLNGASEATLNVKGEVNCVLSGASRLYFLGNPIMGDITVTGASTIKHN